MNLINVNIIKMTFFISIMFTLKASSYDDREEIENAQSAAELEEYFKRWCLEVKRNPQEMNIQNKKATYDILIESIKLKSLDLFKKVFYAIKELEIINLNLDELYNMAIDKRSFEIIKFIRNQIDIHNKIIQEKDKELAKIFPSDLKNLIISYSPENNREIFFEEIKKTSSLISNSDSKPICCTIL